MYSNRDPIWCATSTFCVCIHFPFRFSVYHFANHPPPSSKHTHKHATLSFFLVHLFHKYCIVLVFYCLRAFFTLSPNLFRYPFFARKRIRVFVWELANASHSSYHSTESIASIHFIVFSSLFTLDCVEKHLWRWALRFEINRKNRQTKIDRMNTVSLLLCLRLTSRFLSSFHSFHFFGSSHSLCVFAPIFFPRNARFHLEDPSDKNSKHNSSMWDDKYPHDFSIAITAIESLPQYHRDVQWRAYVFPMCGMCRC